MVSTKCPACGSPHWRTVWLPLVRCADCGKERTLSRDLWILEHKKAEAPTTTGHTKELADALERIAQYRVTSSAANDAQAMKIIAQNALANYESAECCSVDPQPQTQ